MPIINIFACSQWSEEVEHKEADKDSSKQIILKFTLIVKEVYR